MLQYKYKCRYLLDVPPESFYPAPKVDSAIVSLTPRTDYDWHQVDETNLNQVVSKAVSNSLKGLFSSEQLIEAGIDPLLRPENIELEKYISLSKLILN
jgi:16S rRNA (adenine1518-N6/adenine1519-N6)-dimethyltransferase